MKKWVLLTAVGLASMSASAIETKTISTGSKAKVHLDVQGIGKRVCFYDDKAYSLGSVIKVESVLLECVPEKEFEQNGALRWNKVTYK